MHKFKVGFLVLVGLVFAEVAHANEFCDMDTALSAYKAAYNRKKFGNVESAQKTFLKLGNAGIAPAQRHVAEYYLEESREDMALENAIMWSQLAAWGGDDKAKDIVKDIKNMKDILDKIHELEEKDQFGTIIVDVDCSETQDPESFVSGFRANIHSCGYDTAVLPNNDTEAKDSYFQIAIQPANIGGRKDA